LSRQGKDIRAFSGSILWKSTKRQEAAKLIWCVRGKALKAEKKTPPRSGGASLRERANHLRMQVMSRDFHSEILIDNDNVGSILPT